MQVRGAAAKYAVQKAEKEKENAIPNPARVVKMSLAIKKK
jgi:hypothetical protein